MNKTDITQPHPDYLKMLPRWVMEYDFFRSGEHVLNPQSIIRKVRWEVKELDDEEYRQGRKVFRTIPHEVRTNFYIFKHLRESLDEWRDRCDRAYHIPVFRPLINILASAVLKTGPQRSFNNPIFSEIMDNIDDNESEIDPFCREALTMGLVFGRYHAITDMPLTVEPIKTMADQREMGLRPYTYLLSPFDFINWSIDEKSRFRWIVVREDSPDMRKPGDKLTDCKSQYRVWYPDGWELWTANDKNQFSRTNGGEHKAGVVPISTIYANRGTRTLLGCESPLASIVDIDRSVFNKLSLLDELLYKQTFSILAIGYRDGMPIGDIQVGPDRGLQYNNETGAPMFISPDSQQARVLHEIIKDMITAARMASEIGRGGAEESMGARSAAAIGAEQSDRGNIMSSLAESMESFEENIFYLSARHLGITDEVEVNYSRRFDLRTLNQQIADLVQLQNTQIDSRVIQYLGKPIVARMMKEAGSSDVEIEEVLRLIDEQIAKGEIEEPSTASAEEINPNSFSADNQAIERAMVEPDGD